MAIADPPYGDTSLQWDRRLIGWPAELLPVLKPAGSLWTFGSFRMFLAMAAGGDYAAWKLAQDLVWEKHNGSSFHADRFKRVHELAVQHYPADVAWADVYKAVVTTPDATARTVRRKHRPAHTGQIGGHAYESHDGGPRLARSVLYVPSCHGYAENETQKPEGIVDPLIRYSCPPGGLVLSPFMGSGTDLLAARALGRRAIGCDLRESQCEIAARRLSSTLPLGCV